MYIDPSSSNNQPNRTTIGSTNTTQPEVTNNPNPLNTGVVSISTINTSQAIHNAAEIAKPILPPLTPEQRKNVEYVLSSIAKDPEGAMLALMGVLALSADNVAVGLTANIDSVTNLKKADMALRHEKLLDNIEKMNQAQEAANKGGIFSIFSGIGGVLGGILTVLLGASTMILGIGPVLIAAGVAMTAVSSAQMASPETYNAILSSLAKPLSEMLEGLGCDKKIAEMIGKAVVQGAISIGIGAATISGGGVGIATAVSSGMIQGFSQGVGQIGQAASNIKAADYKHQADMKKAEAQQFSEELAKLGMDQAMFEDMLKKVLEHKQKTLDAVIDTLKNIQDTKQQATQHINQTSI